MVQITKVRFTMGNKSSRRYDDKPQRDKEINPYYISATEITNAQYAAFLTDAYATTKVIVNGGETSELIVVVGNFGVSAGKHLAWWINSNGADDKPSWLTFSDDRFGVVSGYENLPVVAVTWYGAYAFAEHYGFRLPTEAEWECASRGGMNDLYGTKSGKANVYEGLLNYNDIKGEPTAVGSYPPNRLGLRDLAGNVREWCLDKYDTIYYNTSPNKNPYNKLSPEIPDDRVIRGGAFDSPGGDCMSSARDHANPGSYDNRTGFRVVLSFYQLQ